MKGLHHYDPETKVQGIVTLELSMVKEIYDTLILNVMTMFLGDMKGILMKQLI